MFAPAASQHVHFPSSFGRRFIVCVDTEEEFDWASPKRRDAVSTLAIRALPTAQSMLRAAGVSPTYLIDYPVASDATSIDVIGGFLSAGECLVGTQLHPWVSPPFDESVNGPNSFPGNLPRSIERAKLLALTEQVHTAFGVRPIIYRAGRYGIGPNSEAILTELGYRVDCSVRPLFDYRSEGGPSFWRAPARPYWTGIERRLLEIPATTLFVGALRAVGGPLFRLGDNVPRLRGALARTGLLNRVVLTPEGMPLDETLQGLSRLVEDGAELFSVAFHSPSVEPGHTPFVRDEQDLRQFYAWLDGVFDFFARHGITPATPIEVLRAAEAARDGCPDRVLRAAA